MLATIKKLFRKKYIYCSRNMFDKIPVTTTYLTIKSANVDYKQLKHLVNLERLVLISSTVKDFGKLHTSLRKLKVIEVTQLLTDNVSNDFFDKSILNFLSLKKVIISNMIFYKSDAHIINTIEELRKYINYELVNCKIKTKTFS